MLYLRSTIDIQSALKPSFNCLYLLENSNFYMLEIKRTDLSIDADLGTRYQWLKVNKTNFSVSYLNFRAMDASAQVEERFFEEGYLKFNYNQGTFIEKYNSAQHQLEQKNNFELPVRLKQAIDSYLSFSKAS